MSARRNVKPVIDRLLQYVCTHHVDALCFQTGDRLRVYANGKSCIVGGIEESITESDTQAIAECIIPEPGMDELESAGKTSNTFHYRHRDNQLIRFEVEAERTRDGLRVVIWRRGDTSVSEQN